MVSHKWLDTPEGRQWRRKVIELRDGYCAVYSCQVDCLQEGGFRPVDGAEFYRVFPLSSHPDLKSDPENGFILCPDCAREAEGSIRLRRERWLLDGAQRETLLASPGLRKYVQLDSDYDDGDEFDRLVRTPITEEQLEQRRHGGSWSTIDSDLPSMGGYNSTRPDRG